MRRGGQLCLTVGFHVLRRCTKRQVRANDTHGKKEGFTALGQTIHLLQSFICYKAIRISRVRSVEGLKDIHVFGVLADFTIGQAMHDSSWMLPWTSGQ